MYSRGFVHPPACSGGEPGAAAVMGRCSDKRALIYARVTMRESAGRGRGLPIINDWSSKTMNLLRLRMPSLYLRWNWRGILAVGPSGNPHPQPEQDVARVAPPRASKAKNRLSLKEASK